MKKNMALLFAAVLLCTGCKSGGGSEISAAGSSDSSQGTTAPVSSADEPVGGEDGSEADNSSAADNSAKPEITGEPEITAEPEPDGQDFSITPGVWRGDDGYYTFREDGSGAVSSFELGIGVAFEYEIRSGGILFHMGSVDNITQADVSDIAEDSFTLTSVDGAAERLYYVSDMTDDFVFYTDEELQKLALAYYEANFSYSPSSCGIRHNEDGTATIQLYDSLEDHNSTSAWYTVDRVSLVGTDDMSGSEVDLSEYVDSLYSQEAMG